jgi:hypothetical protein
VVPRSCDLRARRNGRPDCQRVCWRGDRFARDIHQRANYQLADRSRINAEGVRDEHADDIDLADGIPRAFGVTNTDDATEQRSRARADSGRPVAGRQRGGVPG